MSGRRPSQGGRDHSSHRLVAVGLSEPRAVATLWMLAAAGGGVSLLLQRHDQSWSVIVSLTLRARDDHLRGLPRADPRVRGRRAGAARRRRGDAARRQLHVQAAGRGGAARPLPRSRSPTTPRTGSGSRARCWPTNYPLFLQSLPIVLAVAAPGALRRRRLSRHVAVLRHDGRRRVRARASSLGTVGARAGHPATSTGSRATRASVFVIYAACC